MVRPSTTKRLYVASPYSHDDPQVMEDRRTAVCKFAGDLIRPGYSVFCPIAHNVAIVQQTGVPTGWEQWKDQDLGILEVCDELVVCMLPGWKESQGVAGEIKRATELGKPISYVYP